VPGQRREIEPEVMTAVSDFGGAPGPARDERPVEAPAQADAPRRRSTVRERVSFGSGSESEAPARPAPEPVPANASEPAAAPAAETKDQPRRTGWWAKKLLGS
jgi:ribonuclease E